MNKNFFLVLIVGGAAGWVMWHIDRFQGCLSNQQTLELHLNESRAVACNQADLSFVDINGDAPQLELDCGDGPRRVVLFGAAEQDAGCGFTLAADETWKDGTVGTWNTRVTLTWSEE